MLQWMGGSRRKVTASRKATQNRQRQYFDQRKRKFQVIAVENNLDGREKHPTNNEEPRSLDVLSLMDLSVLVHQESKSHSASGLEVDASVKHASICTADEIANDIPTQSGCLDKAFKSPSNYVSMQDTIPLRDSTGKNMLSAMHLLSKKSNQVKEQRRNALNDLSVIDLVSDGGICTERSPAEAHVAFSIQGLGQVDMRTPLHTPERPKRRSFLSSLPWNKELGKDSTAISINSGGRDCSPGPRNSYLSSRRVAKEELWNPTEWQLPLDLEHLSSKSKVDSVLHDEQGFLGGNWESDFNSMDSELSWSDLEMDDTTDSVGFLSEKSFPFTAVRDRHKKKSKSVVSESRKRNSLRELQRNFATDDDVKTLEEEDPFINFDDISCLRSGVWSRERHSPNALKPKSETRLPQFCNSQRHKESESDFFLDIQCPLHDKELMTFPLIGMPLEGDIVPTDYEIASTDHLFHVSDSHPSRPFTKYETVNHLDSDSPWDEVRHEHAGSHYVLDPTYSYGLNIFCGPDPNKARLHSTPKRDARISLNSHFQNIQSRVEGFSFPGRRVTRRLFTSDSYLQTMGSIGTSKEAQQKQSPVTDNISCSKSGKIAGAADSKHSCNGCELAKDNSKESSNMSEGGNDDTHNTVENEVSRSSSEHVKAPVSWDEYQAEPDVSINKGDEGISDSVMLPDGRGS